MVMVMAILIIHFSPFSASEILSFEDIFGTSRKCYDSALIVVETENKLEVICLACSDGSKFFFFILCA